MRKILAQYLEIVREIFVPDEICEGVEEIALESLYKNGYRVMLLDVDNTLLTYDTNLVSLAKLNWIQKVKNTGFRVFLISNNIRYKRLIKVAKQLNVSEGLFFALKPFPFSVKKFAQDKCFDLTKSIVVGDQLFTDVLMGNWLRCYTILVDPLNKKLSFFKTMQRDIELFILDKLTG